MYVVPPVTNLIRQARHGVLRHRVDEVARLISLTDKEMAYILNMSVRGLHGKSATEPLSLAAGERLLLLERLIQHGLAVFDSRVDLLNRWLHTPLAELAYREGLDESTETTTSLSVQQMGSFAEPVAHYLAASAKGDLQARAVPQSPLAVLDTVSGFSLAEDVLGRIQWGIVG